MGHSASPCGAPLHSVACAAVVTYNPFDPAQVEDHFPILDELRVNDPVHEVLDGVYYVARHDDVVAVARDPVTFRQAGFRPLDADRRSRDELGLGETDPPFHTTVRRALASVLGLSRVKGHAPFVQRVCHELVGVVDPDHGPVDIISALASPLPAIVIGGLSGLSAGDREKVRDYCDDFIRAGSGAADGAAALARCTAFDERLRDVIGARRASGERHDDFLTALIECIDEDGRPISDERILTHLSKDILVGGVETTTHLVGNLVFQVLSTPGLYQRVRSDRSLVPIAVEESLRHLAPVQVVFRRTTRDARIGDVDVPAGALVVLGLSSANRDLGIFDRADEFDIDRDPTVVRQHLGFNWGIHLCVGAPLARLEAAAALDALLDRFEHLELADGARYERVPFFMMRGPARLRVVAA
jgi:cytochrome P450